jgi:glyceraldehyde 3-phosphate dehydrogenase
MSPTTNEAYTQTLKKRILEERAAVEFIKITTDLWFEKSIELVLFRNQLHDQRHSEILSLHEYVRDFAGKDICIHDTLYVARELVKTDLAPARMDIGRLTTEWMQEKNDFASITDFIQNKLNAFLGAEHFQTNPKDVVLYGFGRIGRLLARELMSQEGRGEQLRLRAIVTRSNDEVSLEKRASLLRTDSVHGAFPGTVKVDNENKALIINGHQILMIAASQPEDIDYTVYGINDALIMDNTGAFTDKEALSRHLASKGSAKVLLTAPGKGIPNIVHGVNQNLYSPDEHDIFSAASCTTNAITPILKVIEDNFGIDKGHVETIHAYTNDQNLVDNMHKKYRRGRAAALNMVITETGAGKAVTKCIPELEGKLTSNAIRVPTPNGSLAILNLNINKETTKEDLNDTMRNYALTGDMVEQIQYSLNNELVSSDIVGNPCPSIYDSPATIVSADGKSIVLYVWYDNEYGYSRQVMRLAKHIAKVRRLRYY